LFGGAPGQSADKLFISITNESLLEFQLIVCRCAAVTIGFRCQLPTANCQLPSTRRNARAFLARQLAMAENEISQRAIISSLITQRAEEIADMAIPLWDALSAQLIPIIGRNGFSMLFARSIHLAQATYPWLAADQAPIAGAQFAALKNSFTGHTAAENGTACRALLVIFTDILSLLIGEPLTIGILRAAWGEAAVDGCDKTRNTDHE
jgi:hypothetical protein